MFMTRIRRHHRDTVQNPLATYLREINDTALLNAEEERELAHSIARGDTLARERIVRANLRLVVKIARGYIGKGVPLQDLIGEGNLGLLRAVPGFDPAVGTRFSTYASQWIKQSIKHTLASTAKPIRVPQYMVELLFKWRRMAANLQESVAPPATVDEIARALNVPTKTAASVTRAKTAYNLELHSDQPDTGWSLGEILIDDRAQAPDAVMVDADNMRVVLDRLDEMDQREATVLRMRFGLNDATPKTLKQIGESLGLTRERIRQIETEALGKLSAAIQGD
jgi:RNA polymerase primary sigma factor